MSHYLPFHSSCGCFLGNSQPGELAFISFDFHDWIDAVASITLAPFHGVLIGAIVLVMVVHTIATNRGR